MKTSHFEVTFEQREIRRADGTGSHSCSVCPDASPMITAENAAKVLRLSTRQIYRLIDAGAIHYFETENLQMLVCLASLSEWNAGGNVTTLAAINAEKGLEGRRLI